MIVAAVAVMLIPDVQSHPEGILNNLWRSVMAADREKLEGCTTAIFIANRDPNPEIDDGVERGQLWFNRDSGVLFVCCEPGGSEFLPVKA